MIKQRCSWWHVPLLLVILLLSLVPNMHRPLWRSRAPALLGGSPDGGSPDGLPCTLALTVAVVPLGRIRRAALQQLLSDADPDLVAAPDGDDRVGNLSSAVHAALPHHGRLLVGSGAAGVPSLWARRSLFVEAPSAREPAAGLARIASSGACKARAAIGAGRSNDLPRFAAAAAGPLVVGLSISADETPTGWREMCRRYHLQDSLEALGAPAEATSPADSSWPPPHQSASVVLGGGAVALGTTVCRRWLGKQAEPPGAHWPLLVAVRLEGVAAPAVMMPSPTPTPQPASAGGGGGSGGSGAVPGATPTCDGCSHQGRCYDAERFPQFDSASCEQLGGGWKGAAERRAGGGAGPGSLVATLKTYDADIVCVQESVGLAHLLGEALPTHTRILSAAKPPPARSKPAAAKPPAGAAPKLRLRETDSTVLFRTSAFALLGEGEAPLGSGRTLAHLLHPDEPVEYESGRSPRVGQTRALLRVVRELGGGRAEPVLLMGDFNDPHLPRWHLRAAGYVDAFTALGVTPEPTFPAHPLATWDLMYPHARRMRPLAAQVLRAAPGGEPPSDHWPLIAAWAPLAPDATPPPLMASYDPATLLLPPAYRSCGGARYDDERRSGKPRWRVAASSAVRGHDYGCPEGLDLAALSNASSKAQRKEAAAVCRVCAAAAVAICEAHGERCAGFELNGAQLVATLKGAPCLRQVDTGNTVVVKVGAKNDACSAPQAGKPLTAKAAPGRSRGTGWVVPAVAEAALNGSTSSTRQSDSYYYSSYS
ncbi:hypothetical protein EMIHUDRAFT_447631 [Emiliania huxleyi CCMP1516]|uniref:Endonuclease/exonuclease/phosphatase domain-containing protein n=2 Tax=Emiliania huxleyi TaxID=2903 RepID=A0A0D3JGS5_EMIH1|nr:hypothetical protein EMIHUDRAFT_447631 [Emiliania huxleyi CCMP1516]EOD22710.1 hypothetical protein EMIHUDRAFT_447631 [Emiliania huxleyi CCMP1516]|eukprot:XP_005775139.1 hypothetical protein EMIHUDRAFT_447631 [Emiliania huxleyi CCMP1516]